MEAAGLAAACASLLGTLSGLIKFSKKIHDAPKDWQRYCDLLSNFHQLLNVIDGLTRNMEGLDKVNLTHNGRNYGLVEFCANNANTALEDAERLLVDLEQKGNRVLSVVKQWFRGKRKQLLFVLREQEIQGCIQRIDTAMVGLSIAIHAASLARTNISYNENKNAIDDLTGQLAKNFEKLEKSHQESLGKLESKTIQFIVSAPRRHRHSPAIPWPHSKRAIQSQTVRSSTVEAPSHSTAAQEQSQELEQDHEGPGSASQGLLGSQLEPTSEMELEAIAHTLPFPSIACELSSPTNQEYDIEITCEDGSVAFIPAGPYFDGDESAKARMALVKMADKPTNTGAPRDANAPPSDAEELLEFLVKDESSDGMSALVGTTSTKLVNIGSFFRFKFASINNEGDADSVESDPSIFQFLCVEKFIRQTCTSDIIARRPCHEFPWCDHTKIKQLDGGMSANELCNSNAGHVLSAPHDDGRGSRIIKLFKGFDASVHEKCSEPCDHTQIEGVEDAEDAGEGTVVRCMTPLHVLVLIGTIPVVPSIDENNFKGKAASGHQQYSSGNGSSAGSGNRSSTSSGNGSSAGSGNRSSTSSGNGSSAGSGNRSSTSSGNGSSASNGNGSSASSGSGSSAGSASGRGVHVVGPFPSVPCLFCRTTALNPKQEGNTTSNSVIPYGSHSYGYRCARCDKITWVTGAQQPGFEQAGPRKGAGELDISLRSHSLTLALPLTPQFPVEPVSPFVSMPLQLLGALLGLGR